MFGALKHGLTKTIQQSPPPVAAEKLPARLDPENMNRLNKHDKTINYRDPLTASRRGRRSFALRTFNDRSLEAPAMNAHLRAAAYGGRAPSQSKARKSARSFLNLSREYDAQARDNFAKEIAIFAVIIIGAVAWPFIHSMRVFAN